MKPTVDGSDIFIGQGEMASLMRATDWSRTSLGPVGTWPESLKAAVRILLTSRFDMWLGWGKDVAFLYNDAYRPTLGDKHPQSLGRATRDLWSEIWADVEPLIRTVYERAEGTWSEALLLLLDRHGYLEETYHTFSYSPVFDDAGEVGGLLCAVVEDTERVLTTRRLDTLRLLASSLTTARDADAVASAVQDCLAGNSHDLPFWLLYAFDGDATKLIGRSGIALGHAVVSSDWPLREGRSIISLGGFADLPCGAWQQPPNQAAIVPLQGQGAEAPVGALVVGLSPHRAADDDYVDFLTLVAGQIASGLASVEAYEAERRRAAVLAEAVQLREQAADALQHLNKQLKSEVEMRTGERDRLRDLFRNAPSFMCILRGPDMIFEFVNEAYMQLIGHRDVIGMTLRQALPEVEGQGFFDLLNEVYRTRTPFVGHNMAIDLQRAPGSPLEQRFVNLVYQPIMEGDGSTTGVFAEGHDVTEQVRGEIALRELNADLERQVIERTQARGLTWQVSPDLLGALNAQGYFETSNPAWQTMLGWSEEEVAGMSIFELLHPDDVDNAHSGFDLTQVGQPALHFDNRIRRKDGGYRWISWIGIPDDGMVYCSGRDITEQKAAEAELANAQDALRQAQKMEAVGQLTGGIAHDFNNLLAGISGNLELLKLRIDQGRTDKVDRYIDGASESARRAASLTQRLLAFSRRQTLDPTPTDVNKLIMGMEDLVRRTVGPSIMVEIVGAGGLWLTRVDQSQLENALLNLVINARDAMAQGGRITIETANKWLDDRAAHDRDLPPGQYISLCVTDTGTGMAPDVIAKAFDPFFTTKPLGQGTGLGLSMIHGFVRQSGGQVRIYSEIDKGTTMCLYLPRFVGELDDKKDDAPSSVADLGHGEVVMVIDDEAGVRALMTEVLQDAGYAVIEAVDGPSGLRILQSDIRIDLLITDVGLPGGLNGRQVADAARITRPDLRILFVTGYAENAAVGNGHLDPGMQVITKPFGVVALSNKVTEMLER